MKNIWQLMRYGIIGVLATFVQLIVFYAFAIRIFSCLTPNDWAVIAFGFSAAEVSDATRGLNFVICTTIAFVVSNFFCWVMNRKFVFVPGKFKWYIELGMFYAASTIAAALAIVLSWICINYFGLMTTLAVFVEIVVSFMVNYFVRKFLIFKE